MTIKEFYYQVSGTLKIIKPYDIINAVSFTIMILWIPFLINIIIIEDEMPYNKNNPIKIFFFVAVIFLLWYMWFLVVCSTTHVWISIALMFVINIATVIASAIIYS